MYRIKGRLNSLKYNESAFTMQEARKKAKIVSLLDGDAYVYQTKNGNLIEKWTLGRRSLE